MPNRKGTRGRKAGERETIRFPAIGSFATAQGYLTACKDASRTRTHVVSTQPHDATARARAEKPFDRVVYLRGISGRTFNLMIGATREESRFPQDELAFGCITHSPSDARYNEHKLINTRKGKKLVQRATKEASIVIPSLYQAGLDPMIERDVRVLAETSERIAIDTPHTVENARYFTEGDALTRKALLASGATHPHKGQPLDVPERIAAEIPSAERDNEIKR